MTFGIEMAALAALPFAAALGLGAGFAALDVVTGRSFGFVLALLASIALVAVTFVLLTQTFAVDFKTEVFAIAPLTALIGLFFGYGLGKVAKSSKAPVK